MVCTRLGLLNNLIYRVNSFAEGYRQNLAILGELYIGKTTLIKDLIRSNRLRRDAIIIVYLEAKPGPFELLVKLFIKSIIRQLTQNDASSPENCDPSLLIEENLGKVYPKTAQVCMKILQDLEKGRFDEAFSFMLDIPMVVFEETRKRCVLIIDEFHNLENFQLRHPCGTLAKKIMIQKDTMYVLISSRQTLAQRLLNEKLRLLFGNFERIELGPLDANTSRAFLQSNINSTNLPPIYLDFITSICGGRPFYMQVLSEEIDRSVYSRRVQPEDYTEIVLTAFKETLFKKTGILNQIFFNIFLKISEGRLVSKSTSVLLSLSTGNKKQSEIVKSSGLQQKDVSKALSRLMELDIIVRNGSFYRFRDNLFSYWLQTVYLKRFFSSDIDDLSLEEYFKRELTTRLDAFMEEFGKELYLRLSELFRLFKNDVIQLNGRRHRFLPFNEVYIENSDTSKSPRIIAIGGKNKWLCTVLKDYATENNIYEITKEFKETPGRYGRINRHILICLSGINENAYLMAKEARFWVWGLEEINVLLELYDKPHIM